jgi:16S rRNA (guanine966-N2)-methyltransferase
MRIIAGEYRGRQLKTLRGRVVRPTSDRLRETLFNVLRGEVPGAVFLDCYAGAGAVGLEALSRGAEQAIFIERDAAAVVIVERNISALGAVAQTRIVRADVKAGLRKLAAQGIRADICFLDPPYALLPAALRSLSWLCDSSLMRPEGIIILEHGGKDSSPLQTGKWRRVRLLQQGSSALSFYRRE